MTFLIALLCLVFIRMELLLVDVVRVGAGVGANFQAELVIPYVAAFKRGVYKLCWLIISHRTNKGISPFVKNPMEFLAG